MLLVGKNAYMQSVYLSSANVVTGSVFETASGVTGYFNLREINKALQERNSALENEVLNLKDQIAEYSTLVYDSIGKKKYGSRFDYQLASVINNSTRHPKNFFTINKGTDDGVNTGMGVVDHNGVVGIVNVSGKHMSRVISILNETQHFSVKLKDTPFVGTLSWKGGDPYIAYMEEVPRHVEYQLGDTIVTSGYSTTFPEGIPVGTVMARVKGSDDSFFILKIRLASDFRGLSTVRVIKDIYKNEIDSLQSLDNKELK